MDFYFIKQKHGIFLKCKIFLAITASVNLVDFILYVLILYFLYFRLL